MAKPGSESVWLLSRIVNGAAGESYMQNVTVYAGSAREARSLVSAEFARLRRLTGKGGEPYEELPDWNVEQVKLDAAKLITIGLTT